MGVMILSLSGVKNDESQRRRPLALKAKGGEEEVPP
jgi:hypothetical protein